MKDARDIRLIGFGLVAGMVLGYFIASQESPPASGTAPMTLAQTAPTVPVVRTRTVPRALEAGDFTPFVPFNVQLQGLLPDRDRRQLRIVPAQKLNDLYRLGPWEWQGSPGTPSAPHYDLIDLNYVPDFKLPPN